MVLVCFKHFLSFLLLNILLVDNGAARIVIRWMIRECFKIHGSIIFNSAGMKDIGLDPVTIYPVVFQPPPAIQIDSIHPKPFIHDPPKK